MSMEGAWAKVLHAAQVTGAGRPQLQNNEIESLLLDSVELDLESTPNTPVLKGVVILTTHRIIWLDQKSKIAGAIPLASVCKIFPVKKSLKNMFATPRMRIQLWSSGGKIALGSTKATEAAITVSLLFRDKNTPESFTSRLKDVVAAKAWEADLRSGVSSEAAKAAETGTTSTSGRGSTKPPAAVGKMNPAMAGVSGILRKEKEQLEAADKNLQEAFQDLNALMGKAKDMVNLAVRMRNKLIAAPATPTVSVDEGGEMGKQEIKDWLLSVGIASPVTKESAGALYHQQLARQLADFIKVPLEKSGGMLAMVDAYCLFNRARGTELISPEDLLQACMTWSSIDVPVLMRRFDSGVRVIQSKGQSDDNVFGRIDGLVRKPEALRQGIGASDAARSLGIAPALANEYLLAAENKGFLCRDDGADGLRFFANFFMETNIVSRKSSVK